MKALNKKFSAVYGLLFSALLLTSFFLSATETFAAERVTENSGINSDQSKANHMAKAAANETGFIENKGQVLDMEAQPAPYVDYVLDRGSTQIFLLGEAGIAWQFKQVHYPDGYEELNSRKGNEDGDFIGKLNQMNEQVRTETYRMDMVLEDANPNTTVSTEGKSADYFNYYNADALEVHHFEQVTYHDVYPGIDWVIYTNASGVKYDFIVHPGADPNQIKLKFQHHEELYLDDMGNLIHRNRLGSFTEFAPVSFQEGREVLTEFLLQDDILQFELGEYNPEETLTIDPARIWATYYGDSGIDNGNATAVDNDDNVYLSGRTTSSTNIASGGYQETLGGITSAFLVKFNSAGVRLWGTYYGGSGSDGVWNCVTDGSNNIIVAGWTDSPDNIAVAGHQSTLGGDTDALLVKFNASGFLQWATYYGGAGFEVARDCTTDIYGSVYISGETNSSTSIASGGHQNTIGGDTDAFLVKFDSLGVRQWGTYYGGSGAESLTAACITDSLGNVYLGGQTESTSGIAVGGHQNTYAGDGDAFLVKFTSLGVRLWGTYYGEVGLDRASDCAIDPEGNVYLFGGTISLSGLAFNGHQSVNNGSWDALLVKFDPTGVRQWATYYGGSGTDLGLRCATDGLGNVYICGETNSAANIASGGFQNIFGGAIDGYLVQFDSSGVRQWGTYYGGIDFEIGMSCAVDSEDNVYLAGNTSTPTGIASGGHQNVFGGFTDAFLTKFGDELPPPGPCIHSTLNATVAAPTDNTPVLIDTCSAAGEYHAITSVVFGETYEFASSVGADWLVLTDALDNVLVEGTTPISWTADFNGTVHLHISEDSDCNTGGGCRQPTVTCTSCVVITSCIHPNAVGVASAGSSTLPVIIHPCTHAGDYNTITDIVSGQTYQFVSSEGTDWMVLTDESNNLLVEGTSPISWTASFSGTVRLHVSVNSDCDTESVCRVTTVSCTSCLTPPGCIHSTAVGSVSAPTGGDPLEITSCIFAGQYTVITDIVSGETYAFVSSVGSDWLVLTDDADNILVEGFPPLNWTASFSGTVRLHISTNPNCGIEAECRSTSVQCNSCSILVGCIHPTANGTATAPTDGDPLEITSCVFAGEYNTINGIVSGETYAFSSSESGDWLVLTDDSDNFLAEGFSPLNWTASFSGTVRLHISANPNCGTESECRTTSVQATSIVSPETCCENPLPGPGCPQYPDCEEAVCASDAFCCNTEWDATCASSAISLCGIPECSPAACASPTLTPHTSTDCIAGTYDVILDIGGDGNAQFYDVFVALPACDEAQITGGFSLDPACESAICAGDSFCCDDTWDGVCALSAASEPACTECLAPQNDFIGTFASGTTGIGIGTFPVDVNVEVSVFHDWDSSCDQDISISPEETCGCTDDSAVNFDPDAEIDDGSCVFAMANDDCANAEMIPVTAWPSVNYTPGTLTGAFGSGWGACIGVDGPDVFYTFNAATTNHYFINLNAYGGFSGVIELYDECSGTLLECFGPGNDCAVGQGSSGFPDDPNCEAAVCAVDDFCCSDTWDGICGSIAADPLQVGSGCDACVGGLPAPTALAMELPAGNYTIRVRNADGQTILDTSGDFLIGVQSFPTAKVQDNPVNFLYACNQGGFQLEDFVGAAVLPSPLPGILDYEWFVAEQGGTFQNAWQRGAPNYSARLDWLGMDYGATYNVYVRIQLDVPGLGQVWGVYQGDYGNPNFQGASVCTISTSSNVTPTELRPNYTPTNAAGNDYSLCDFALAYNVSGSQNFRWRFDPDVNPNNGNELFYTRGIGSPSVRLNWVNGLTPGLTYNVAVEVKVSGQWSGYSTVLPLTLDLPPNDVVIRSQFCGGTYASNGYILSESVCDADLYQFRFTPIGGVTPSYRNSSNYACFMSAANPALTPGDYDVQVKVTQNGVPGDWGPACTITIAGPQDQESEAAALRSTELMGSATLFPNPNAGSEVRLNLDGLSDGNHKVMIQVYDVYGKLVSSESFGHEGAKLSRLASFNDGLATGMYMVQINVDGDHFTTERLVVR